LSAERAFPFVPESSRDLQVGDFFGVALGDGQYGCAIVTDLKSTGVASRTTFVAGLVDWMGNSPPSRQEIARAAIFDQGLTRLEAINRSGSAILGSIPLPANLAISPNYRDSSVGTLHRVFGWKVLPRLIEAHFRLGQAKSPNDLSVS